ncbi:hypothetical protein CYMTET_12264, partial [Cymbomonas tetramitiformis]
MSERVKASETVIETPVLVKGLSAITVLAQGLPDTVVATQACGSRTRRSTPLSVRYPARVDPRPLLATEHRLARENRALDWRPTEATRKQQLFDRLDPELNRMVLDRYPMPSRTAGSGAAALATGDDIKHCDPALKAILDKIAVLEHFFRGGCKGPLTPAMKKAAMGPRNGLNGYRAGDLKKGRPPVGFDKAEIDARRPTLQAAKHTGTAAAFCCPLDEEDMQAMALAQTGVLTCGVVAIAPAPAVERPETWPRTIECAAPHEIMAQLGAGFQISLPPADVQDVKRPARRPAVGCGVPPLGFGMPAMGAIAMLSMLCISFADVAGSSSTAAAVPE